jgi:TolA-binding protein
MGHGQFCRAILAAALLAGAAGPAASQQGDPFTTRQEVREEIDQAMEAVGAYSAQERDQALARARSALDRLDAEIERREHALREDWSEMSEQAREAARARLAELREARNRLGERYGALQAGTADAWDELTEGFAGAWDAFSEAWDAADGPAE